MSAFLGLFLAVVIVSALVIVSGVGLAVKHFLEAKRDKYDRAEMAREVSRPKAAAQTEQLDKERLPQKSLAVREEIERKSPAIAEREELDRNEVEKASRLEHEYQRQIIRLAEENALAEADRKAELERHAQESAEQLRRAACEDRQRFEELLQNQQPNPATTLCPSCGRRMLRKSGKLGDFFSCSKYPRCLGTRNILNYPPLGETIPESGTEAQNAIWEFIVMGTANGVVEARAGTGKTYVVTNGIARIRGNRKIGVFCFNRHIKIEMEKRLQDMRLNHVRVNTCHSFGRLTILKHFRKAEHEPRKVIYILETLLGDAPQDREFIHAVARLVKLCKSHLLDGKDKNQLKKLIGQFDFKAEVEKELDADGNRIATSELYDSCDDLHDRLDEAMNLVPMVLERCLRDTKTYDFDDMIWWVVTKKLPVDGFDIVFVDEAQDTNLMEQKLIEMVSAEG